MTEGSRVMEWMPIETAPKDGSWILATVGAQYYPAVVRWRAEKGIEGWQDDVMCAPSDYDEWPLAYWMPLPLPPTGDE